jgi:hypothetical protein
MHTISAYELIKQMLAPAVLAAGANAGDHTVNCQGFDRALLHVSVGAFAGTTPTVTVKIQESNDDAATDPYADVANATTAALSAAGIYLIDVKLNLRKKWLKIIATVAGTGSPTAACAVNLELGRARYLAVAQDNTPVSV